MTHRSSRYRAHPARASSWLLAALIATTACHRSADWNSVFHRPQGWLYADGGSSTELPDGRRVWLFGDSMVRHEHGLLYNTLGVEQSVGDRAPLPHEIRFFGRDGADQLLDLSERGSDDMRPWLEPPVPLASSRNTWLWPTDVVVAGGQLVAFYSQVGCAHGDFPACRSYLGNIAVMGHTAVVVDNPMDEPEKWNVRGAPLVDRRGRSPSDHGLHWGSALLDQGGWLYVFGTCLWPGKWPEDVKLARVMPRDVGRYDQWQFLARDGWRMFPTGPTPDDLESIARGGATELSVDRIERNGRTWMVMVQVDPFAQEVVVRSAAAADIDEIRWAGPEAGPDVKRFSLPALDPESTGGTNWAGRAQRRLSPSANSLFVSYFSSQAASLRFVEIRLSDVRTTW
jgi:hypothetical protein